MFTVEAKVVYVCCFMSIYMVKMMDKCNKI